jgi:hypothetical protein
MRSADDRLRRTGNSAGVAAVLIWAGAVVFQLVRHGPDGSPVPIIIFSLLAALFLFFVVSEWTRRMGWVLRHRRRHDRRL